MKIVIKTPGTLKAERSKLVYEAIELMRQQARSNQRYAKRITTIWNKIDRLEEQLT